MKKLLTDRRATCSTVTTRTRLGPPTPHGPAPPTHLFTWPSHPTSRASASGLKVLTSCLQIMTGTPHVVSGPAIEPLVDQGIEPADGVRSSWRGMRGANLGMEISGSFRVGDRDQHGAQ